MESVFIKELRHFTFYDLKFIIFVSLPLQKGEAVGDVDWYRNNNGNR